MKNQKQLSFLMMSLFLLFAIKNTFSQGDFWEQTNPSGPFGTDAIAINSSGHIFAGTTFDGMFRSTDNGDNWSDVNSGLTDLEIRAFAINSNGDIFAGTFGGVFRSTDNGDNWTPSNSGLPDVTINVLAIKSDADIFAGTNVNGVFRSTDNGDNWTEINNGFPTSFGRLDLIVDALAINSDGHIFAGTDKGMFRSTDNGDNWIEINNGFPESCVEALAINSNGDIFAGTFSEGVFRSTDNGDNWSDVNSGLTGLEIRGLAINSDGRIFAGTGGGVFRSVQTTTSVEEITGEIPTSFSLEQNYPNPFNPSTTIQFTVEKSSHVILKLFDITGREVTMLVDETFTPGSYSTVFEADGLPSGIYFYRITAGEFMQTKKLTLLK